MTPANDQLRAAVLTHLHDPDAKKQLAGHTESVEAAAKIRNGSGNEYVLGESHIARVK